MVDSGTWLLSSTVTKLNVAPPRSCFSQPLLLNSTLGIDTAHEHTLSHGGGQEEDTAARLRPQDDDGGRRHWPAETLAASCSS